MDLAPTKLIAMLESDNEDRLAIPLQHYPRLLIDVLLTEDRRFYDRIAGLTLSVLCVQWLLCEQVKRFKGGSTLTAVSENLFLSGERSGHVKPMKRWCH